MKKVLKYILILMLLTIVLSVGYAYYITTKVKIIEKGLVETESSLYVAVKVEDVEMKDYPAVIKKSFESLQDVLEDNKNNIFYEAFVTYDKNPEFENYNLIAGFFIDNDDLKIIKKDFFIGKREESLVRRFEVIGSYKYLKYAWFYIISKVMMDKKNIYNNEENSYEMYIKSYNNEKNPDKFVTVIDIPVKDSDF